MPDSGNIIEVQGQIERVTYFNSENNYTVAKMRIQGRRDLVTMVGTIFSVTPGEILRLKGRWGNHPRYGEQFTVVSYESVLPATVKGIERYLGSGMIKGIGPVMAKRLVSAFGAETLSVIDCEPERLNEVAGIGEKRIEMIRKAWEDQKEIRGVMIFLQGHGISPAYAVKIYRQYGRDSIEVVRDNPYRLAMDVFGIGFITADRIAEKLGIPKDSGARIEAGILYVLQGLADEGHVYYPYGELVRKCSGILEIEEKDIPASLDSLVAQNKIVIDDLQSPPSSAPPSSDAPVYLSAFYVSEVGITNKINEIIACPRQLKLVDADEIAAQAQSDLGITLSGRQSAAVKASINSKILIITGGPGTGKTTIINAIIKVYNKMGRKVLLAAPTGRAAKRITEATGREAKTIHRLLEYSPGGASGEGGFKRNETNPLETDLVVVDEVSMVDTLLMYHFLKALPAGATLVLVGDIDQLPSVGPGNVLKDIIDAGCVQVVRLNEIFRQSRQSMIIVNAHRINNGEMPLAGGDGVSPKDFYFFAIEEPEKVLEKVISLCKEGLVSRFGYNPLDDIQVLTPMHRGTVGVANLNTELQKALNPAKEELLRGGRLFKAGDKVMQIRNNYDKDVYNGDIGRVAGIDNEEQELKVNYDGRIISYDFSDLDEVVLAYAISVHKSQGSEYPVVIMPVLTQHYMLLQRNLFYTGVTRGKKLVILIGTRKALAIAVRNNKPQKRYTLLRERLKREMTVRRET
ncbi:MAG: ATP-dependent RecD-like DNA helicase [Syntrophorhabdus sp. PtaU1.Bin058]|nr:MAG: ATP-dependent RecD-like DNA helicase [Syntrophorhabdus sp. PtaU1.Bin058]